MWQLGEVNYSDKEILCCFRLLCNKWPQTRKLNTALTYFLAICRSDVQAHPGWVLVSASPIPVLLHITDNLLFPKLIFLVCVFSMTILLDKKWYLIVVLIYFSLLINDIEHLFTCLLAVYVAYLEKCPLKSLVNFLMRLSSSLLLNCFLF